MAKVHEVLLISVSKMPFCISDFGLYYISDKQEIETDCKLKADGFNVTGPSSTSVTRRSYSHRETAKLPLPSANHPKRLHSMQTRHVSKNISRDEQLPGILAWLL